MGKGKRKRRKKLRSFLGGKEPQARVSKDGMLQIDISDVASTQRFTKPKPSAQILKQKNFSATDKKPNPRQRRQPSRKTESRGKIILSPLDSNQDHAKNLSPETSFASLGSEKTMASLDEYITKVSAGKYEKGKGGPAKRKNQSRSLRQSPVKSGLKSKGGSSFHNLKGSSKTVKNIPKRTDRFKYNSKRTFIDRNKKSQNGTSSASHSLSHNRKILVKGTKGSRWAGKVSKYSKPASGHPKSKSQKETPKRHTKGSGSSGKHQSVTLVGGPKSIRPKSKTKKTHKKKTPTYYMTSLYKAYLMKNKTDYFTQLFQEHYYLITQNISKYRDRIPTPSMMEIESKMITLPKRPGYEGKAIPAILVISITRLDKKTLIFDLDETLVHCNEFPHGSDICIEVVLPQGQKIKVFHLY